MPVRDPSLSLNNLYDNTPYCFCRDGKFIELDEDEAKIIFEAYLKEHNLEVVDK